MSMNVEQIPEEILAWVLENPDIMQDLVKADTLVEFGKIELVYHDGRYVGLDIQQRLRYSRYWSGARQNAEAASKQS